MLGPEWGLPAPTLAGVSGTLSGQKMNQPGSRESATCPHVHCHQPHQPQDTPKAASQSASLCPSGPPLNLPPHTAGKFQSPRHTPSLRHKLRRSPCAENKMQPPSQPGGPARRAGLLNRAGSVPHPASALAGPTVLRGELCLSKSVQVLSAKYLGM